MHRYLLLIVFFFVSGCGSSLPRTQVVESPPQVENIQVNNNQVNNVSNPTPNGPQVCIKDICFDVEIADEPSERAQGLMWRESMDTNRGMRFIFDVPTAHAAFWMKNTLIPLDMIWVNNDMRIVTFVQHAIPCEEMPCISYDPGPGNARYVLEVNAGLVKQYGFSTGDSVVFKE